MAAPPLEAAFAGGALTDAIESPIPNPNPNPNPQSESPIPQLENIGQLYALLAEVELHDKRYAYGEFYALQAVAAGLGLRSVKPLLVRGYALLFLAMTYSKQQRRADYYGRRFDAVAARLSEGQTSCLFELLDVSLTAGARG